jgi:hypothetical protein
MPNPPPPHPERESSRPSSSPPALRKAARLGLGLILTSLGMLWALQGADLLRIEPILCTADCRPITGGSPGWLAAGVLTLLVGIALLGAPRRHRR